MTTLKDLGWTSAFQAQTAEDDLEQVTPVRVMAVHRGRITVAGPDVAEDVHPHIPDAEREEEFATIGDWILLDCETRQPVRLLDRFSLFKRRAPGAGVGIQLIAANVDTVFIVSSCNDDFNVARLERFLVLALEAGALPVIVLTKADLADAPGEYAKEAAKLQPGLLVETVDAHGEASVACLSAWCGTGQTVAFIGTSGVGKSTLINTLTQSHQATGGIREDDAKGRHTTTSRSLHRLDQGGWLLDTPGMRELQITDSAAGLEDLFGDIMELETQCKFNNCAHESEPGCAVKAAIEAGDLDPDRVTRWRKLAAEDALNTETIAERHTRDRQFGKMVKSAMKSKKDRR